MTPKPTWVDGRVDSLLSALHDLGMSMSRVSATELIHERVRWVSSQMDISATARRYLTDDVLADLARSMVFSLAEETPGADVIESARSAAVPLPILGRCIAGLAETIQIRLRERDDIEHLRTTVAQLAQALSAIGQLTADHPPDPRTAAEVIMRPPQPSCTMARCPRTSTRLRRASSQPPSCRTPRACATTPTSSPAGDYDACPLRCRTTRSACRVNPRVSVFGDAGSAMPA